MLNVYKLNHRFDHEEMLFSHLSLTFPKQGLIGILGKSGCGKSTLLNMMTGLLKPNEGDILYFDKSLFTYSNRDKNYYRFQKCMYIHQFDNFIESLTMKQNFENDLCFYKVKEKERIYKIIEDLNLNSVLSLYPKQLSGGQKQKMAIVRCFMTNCKVILLDEPTGSLDQKSAIELMDMIKELSKDYLIIMVSHNLELVNHYCDHIFRFDEFKYLKPSFLHHYHPISIQTSNLYPSLMNVLRLGIQFLKSHRARYLFACCSFVLGFFINLVMFNAYLSNRDTSFTQLEKDTDSSLVVLTSKNDETLSLNDFDYLETLSIIDHLNYDEENCYANVYLKDNITRQEINESLSNYQWHSDYYDLKESLEGFYQTLFYVFLLFLGMNALLSFVLLNLLLRASYHEQRKDLALLRIRGYPLTHIYFIYIFQAFLVTLISCLIAYSLYLTLFKFINHVFNIYQINTVLKANPISFLLLLSFFLLLCLTSCLFLIRTIFTMKPFDIVKED